MTFLLLVTRSPKLPSVHSYVLALIEAIYAQGHSLRAVYFTAAAAGCAAQDGCPELSAAYVKSAKTFSFPLLCCGRAFRNLGLEPEALNEGFELSGNLELTVMLQECDKSVEF